MGSTLRKRRGARAQFRYRVVDAGGLESVRIVLGGAVVSSTRAGGQKVVTGDFRAQAASRQTYYRLEATSSDSRRAFSSPIYIEPLS